MNDLDFIDYNRPIGRQYDYRTTSYMGLVNIKEPQSTISRKKIRQPTPYEAKPLKRIPLKSEVKENYIRKDPDHEVRNPRCERTQFMKAYEETRLRYPHKLQDLRSVYNSDFRRAVPTTPDTVSKLKTCVENSSIKPPKSGIVQLNHSKLTTQRRDYSSFTIEQLYGIGAKDQITIWSWLKNDNSKRNVSVIREDMCEHLKKCQQRRNEFRSLTKAVPHFGLTTECRSNYTQPVGSSRDELTFHHKQNLNCEPVPLPKYTTNRLYGSGERVDKYLNIQGTGPLSLKH